MNDPLLRLTNLLLKYRQVERTTHIPGSPEEKENDIEHSYHLAMICLYVIDLNQLTNLNRGRVLELSLCHDVVETYAGDTFFYADDATRQEKAVKEAAAADRIHKEFPDFPTLTTAIQEYEDRTTPEACFVYAMDKLVPILIIYLDGGRLWKERNISLEQLIESKWPKIELSPVVVPYLDAILQKLKADPQLFNPAF